MAEITKISLEDELQNSYIDYAMSVIIGRAIPDARDGLKPVQRRILFAMHELKNFHDQPTKKSARVVGECMGKFHPHGDLSIYDAIARLAQDFSTNHLLIEGQGNFGCFTKDTKVKLSDGRNLDFEQLIKEQAEGRRHWTFTFNAGTKSIEISEIKNPRLTRKNAELVEVTLDDDTKIRCTPDHRFLTRSGEYKQAKALEAGDSLMPLYTKPYDGVEDKNLKDYEIVQQPIKANWEFVHRLSDEWNLKEKIYTKSRGKVRHHLDFNKKNNDPTNIQRLSWKEHWAIHYKSASWRHKHDKEYVAKLAAGRKKYIEEHHELISKRISESNRKKWKNPKYRKYHSDLVKNLWKDEQYKERMRKISSQNLKKLWLNPEYAKSMSILTSTNLRIKWTDESYRKQMQQKTQNMSLKLWSNPEHRLFMSNFMKNLSKDPSWRKRQSEISKTLWRNEEYRSKFSKAHFSEIGKRAWTAPKFVELQKEKARKQWQDPNFRAKIINSVRSKNLIRLKENPNLMRDLAKYFGKALREKWKDPLYKQRIIKSKILSFVSYLLGKYPTVTQTIYESERRNNCIPKYDNITKYFSNFESLIYEAKTYNHKVKSILFLSEREDTYDISVGPWHNFALAAGVFVHNSIDGDPPAAMRYTEVRLTRLSEEILEDIDKGTVEMVPNFDNTEKEPLLLPAKAPNLLINGATGIAVGVSTSIPPHNLKEVCEAVVHIIDKPDCNIEEILEIIKGPDFPTGGIAIMSQGAYNGYRYGRGQLTIKAKAEIIPKEKRIVITELPYNVNKSHLIQNMAELVRDKRITGIRDLRDESGKEGIRIVVDLKDENGGDQVLNMLYKYTQLQTTMPLINLAVVGKSLKSLNVQQLLSTFINYRREVILRRTKYDLEIAQNRHHIVEGLRVAIENINDIITLIKASSEVSDARSKLISTYSLSEKQANAILDMKLSRLTHLENDSLAKEKKELESKIEDYNGIIASQERVDGIIKSETLALIKQFGRPRRTEIIQSEDSSDITDEDMIKDDKITILLTNSGYVKRLTMENYKEQDRGGKGIISINLKEGDYLKQILTCNNKDYIICVSANGRIYWLKAYNIPESGRYSEGKAIVNLLDTDEKIVSILHIKDFENSKIAFLTTKGLAKKMGAMLFSKPRSSGVRAITLNEGDQIEDTIIYTAEKYLIITTKNGKAIRFNESKLRSIGRSGMGVRGIRISSNDIANNIISANDHGSILTVTENGYGKITDVTKYREQGRGGKGVLNIKTNQKTGKITKSLFVNGEQKVVLINSKGVSITFPIASIRITGRAAQGVRLMKLESGTKVEDAILMSEVPQTII